MGCALSCAHGVGCRCLVQPGGPDSGLCAGGAFRAGPPRSPAEPSHVENPWAGDARDAAFLARHGANSTVPARYLAEPPAECVLSRRLGSAADRGLAAQQLVSAGGALQYTIP